MSLRKFMYTVSDACVGRISKLKECVTNLQSSISYDNRVRIPYRPELGGPINPNHRAKMCFDVTSLQDRYDRYTLVLEVYENGEFSQRFQLDDDGLMCLQLYKPLNPDVHIDVHFDMRHYNGADETVWSLVREVEQRFISYDNRVHIVLPEKVIKP